MVTPAAGLEWEGWHPAGRKPSGRETDDDDPHLRNLAVCLSLQREWSWPHNGLKRSQVLWGNGDSQIWIGKLNKIFAWEASGVFLFSLLLYCDQQLAIWFLLNLKLWIMWNDGLQLFHMGVALISSVLLKCFWRIIIPQYKHKFHLKADPKSKNYIWTPSNLCHPWVGECEGICLEFWLVGFILFLVLFLGKMVEFHKDLVGRGVRKERDSRGRRSTVHPTSPSDLYHPVQADITEIPQTGWRINKRNLFLNSPRAGKSKIRSGLEFLSRWEDSSCFLMLQKESDNSLTQGH